jgi:hypothetical protein
VRQNFGWKEKLHTFCTDGAPTVLGNASAFATLLKMEAPHVATHCFLYRHAPATETSSNPERMLSTAINVIIYIRIRSQNHRVCKTFCQEIGTEYEVLFYHAEFR